MFTLSVQQHTPLLTSRSPRHISHTMPVLFAQIVFESTSAEFIGVPSWLSWLPSRLELPELPEQLKPPREFRWFVVDCGGSRGQGIGEHSCISLAQQSDGQVQEGPTRGKMGT